MLLLGAPGAGKGTQAAVISEKLGLAHVASGDLFRDHQQRGTELGKLAKGYMERGELVPDEITVKMILERIQKPDCDKGFILDGFPRTVQQSVALGKALGKQGVDTAVYVKVKEAELIRRLSGRWICRNCQTPYHVVNSPPKGQDKCDKCGGALYQRADDTEETARKRLEVYFKQTLPVIEYYRKGGKLTEVDGEQPIETVAKAMVAVLSKKK